MPYIHSSYNANTGTGTAATLTVPNIVVPSVVDGMLIASFGKVVSTEPTLSSQFNGIQDSTELTSRQIDSNSTICSKFHYIYLPAIGTHDLVVNFGIVTRGSVFVMLMVGTNGSDLSLYAGAYGPGTSKLVNMYIGVSDTGTMNPANAVGTYSSSVLNSIGISNFAYINRDTIGAPIAYSGSLLYNTIVNSGGGVDSFGHAVSVDFAPLDPLASYGYSLSAPTTWIHRGIQVLNSNSDALGSATIRHAP